MRGDIMDPLRSGGVVLSDGGLGTMLQASGLPGGAMPESWNLERPDRVEEIHRAYVMAGAQSITANTFGGNRIRLGERGLAERLVDINRTAIVLARQAAGADRWVAASIGPTGRLMEPLGDLTVTRAEDVYAEQIAIVAEAGADVILIETQHDLEEACCAIRMARKQTSLPVFCSFAFNARGRTMMGLRPQAAAQRVLDEGGQAVGANCGEGPAAVLAALQALQGVTVLPLIAQANAGIPQVAGHDHTTTWDITPEDMARHAVTFAALGAQFIGGCCGTTPEHIAAIRRALLRQGTCDGDARLTG